MPTKTIPFGFDAGATKLLLCGPDQSFAFQSAHVAPANHAALGDGDGLDAATEKPLTVWGENLVPMYVGDDAHWWGKPQSNNDFERFTGTSEMRALLYAALTQYIRKHGKLTAPLHVGVALPNEFMTKAPQDEKDRVKQWLLGAHTWHAEGPKFSARQFKVEIEAVTLLAQSVATFNDYLFNDAGKIIADRQDEMRQGVGFINIGGRTVELTVVQLVKNEDGREVFKRVPRFTAGASIGVLEVLKLYKPRGEMAQLEPALRNGALDVKNQIKIWERQPAQFVDDVWGEHWNDWARVALGGGGALVVPHFINRFSPKGLVLPSPVHVVARGIYKSLLARINNA